VVTALRATALAGGSFQRLFAKRTIEQLIVVRRSQMGVVSLPLQQQQQREREIKKDKTSRRCALSFKDYQDAILVDVHCFFVGPCWGGSCWRICHSPRRGGTSYFVHAHYNQLQSTVTHPCAHFCFFLHLRSLTSISPSANAYGPCHGC
jgi:hypothetical protein